MRLDDQRRNSRRLELISQYRFISIFVTKYYLSLSLFLILFDDRSLLLVFTKAYSNIALFYFVTKYLSLFNSV